MISWPILRSTVTRSNDINFTDERIEIIVFLQGKLVLDLELLYMCYSKKVVATSNLQNFNQFRYISLYMSST